MIQDMDKLHQRIPKVPVQKNKFFLNLSFFYAMFLFGINYGMVSPILIELGQALKTPIESMGNFFSMVAAGFIAGSLASSILGRFPVRQKVFYVFYGLLPASIVFLAFCLDYWMLLLAGFVMGTANGLLESNVTVTLSEVNPKREAQVINYSQAAISLGAFTGPLLSTLAVNAGVQPRTVFLSVAFFSFLNFLLLPFLRIPETGQPDASEKRTIKDRIASKMQDPSNGFLRKAFIVLLLFLAMFFFVSSESGIGSWVPTYLRLEKGFSAVLAGNLISFFWLAGGIGRILTGSLTRKLGNAQILLFLCAGSMLTFRVSMLLEGRMAIAVFFLLTGLMHSAIWPMIASLGVRFFPRQRSVFLPLVIMAGGLGAIAAPWAVGQVYVAYGLETGMDLVFLFFLVLLCLVVVLFVYDWKIFRREKKLPSAVLQDPS